MTRRAFTLIELLAVIGILVTLATLTAISVQRIGKDTRLSRATNDVLNMVELTRLQAIREQKPMVLVFVPRVEWFRQPASGAAFDPNNVKRQWTEAVVGRLVDSLVMDKSGGAPSSQLQKRFYNDVFEPHPLFQPLGLAEGVKVAGPDTDNNDAQGNRNGIWRTQPDFRNQESGAAIGIMFAPSGELITRLPGSGVSATAGYRSVVLDLDGDGEKRPAAASDAFGELYWREPEEEDRIVTCQMLAIFDDSMAREMFDTTGWRGTGYQNITFGTPCSDYRAGISRMQCQQSEFINQYGDRLVINRNTGRAEVRRR